METKLTEYVTDELLEKIEKEIVGGISDHEIRGIVWLLTRLFPEKCQVLELWLKNLYSEKAEEKAKNLVRILNTSVANNCIQEFPDWVRSLTEGGTK